MTADLRRFAERLAARLDESARDPELEADVAATVEECERRRPGFRAAVDARVAAGRDYLDAVCDEMEIDLARLEASA